MKLSFSLSVGLVVFLTLFMLVTPAFADERHLQVIVPTCGNPFSGILGGGPAVGQTFFIDTFGKYWVVYSGPNGCAPRIAWSNNGGSTWVSTSTVDLPRSSSGSSPFLIVSSDGANLIDASGDQSTGVNGLITRYTITRDASNNILSFAIGTTTTVASMCPGPLSVVNSPNAGELVVAMVNSWNGGTCSTADHTTVNFFRTSTTVDSFKSLAGVASAVTAWPTTNPATMHPAVTMNLHPATNDLWVLIAPTNSADFAAADVVAYTKAAFSAGNWGAPTAAWTALITYTTKNVGPSQFRVLSDSGANVLYLLGQNFVCCSGPATIQGTKVASDGVTLTALPSAPNAGCDTEHGTFVLVTPAGFLKHSTIFAITIDDITANGQCGGSFVTDGVFYQTFDTVTLTWSARVRFAGNDNTMNIVYADAPNNTPDPMKAVWADSLGQKIWFDPIAANSPAGAVSVNVSALFPATMFLFMVVGLVMVSGYVVGVDSGRTPDPNVLKAGLMIVVAAGIALLIIIAAGGG